MRRQGEYGLDAPYVPVALTVAGAVYAAGFWWARRRRKRALALLAGAGAFTLLGSAASYVYTSRRGKFVVWGRLLDELRLRGDERILDAGCGRGAVLLMAAERLTEGEAVGVDLWRGTDQSGNTLEAAERNAAAEGVADRVTFDTGDIRALPYPDASFDVVLSALAVHNIPDDVGRRRAVREMARLLRPGGRVLIADFRHTGEYAEELVGYGLADVEERYLGWRYWYGHPWGATRLVTARKP